MRRLLIMLLCCAAIAWALTGCRISHEIRDLDRVTRPPLTELEGHLTYRDPDAGRGDYIVNR